MKSVVKDIPKGYKESVLGVIPDDWSIVRLKDKFDRITTKNKKGLTNVLTISAQHGLINQEEYFNKSVASKNLSNYTVLEKGDFAYNKSYSTGYPYGAIKKLKKYDEGVVSPLYICFRPSKNNKSPDFYEQYFEAGMLNREIHAIAQEGARNHGLLNISIGDFFNTFIIDADEKELNKIAEILNTWDKAIELKEKLIEQKKELKKGLMQKLLTGEVRLPGYKYSWKVYTIEQLAEFFTDGDWIEAPYITEDGVLLIQTGNIGIGEYIEKNNMKFISEKSFIELNCTEVKPGDILICRLADPIGRSCIVPNTGMKMITAVDVAIFRVNNNLAVTEFINYKLNLPKTLRKMDSLGAGSTRKRISRKNLGKVKLTIPDLEEQKAIVDILLQIEKNIVLLEKELGELKKQKKGLMQLLLTGKVRVKV